MHSNRLKKDLEMYRNLQQEAADLTKLTELPEDCPDINEDFDKYIHYLSVIGQATCDLVTKLKAMKSMEKTIAFNEQTGVYKMDLEELQSNTDCDYQEINTTGELTEIENNSSIIV